MIHTQLVAEWTSFKEKNNLDDILFYCGTQLPNAPKVHVTQLKCNEPIGQLYYTKFVDQSCGNLKCYACGEDLTDYDDLKSYKDSKELYATVMPVCGDDYCAKHTKKARITQRPRKEGFDKKGKMQMLRKQVKKAKKRKKKSQHAKRKKSYAG